MTCARVNAPIAEGSALPDRWAARHPRASDFSKRTGAWWERLKYFPRDPRGRTYLTLAANLYNVRVSLDLEFGSGWTGEIAGYAFWRQSLGDGIYGPATNLLGPDGGSEERFIGSQADFVLSWQVNRNLSFRGVYSLFKPGPFIEDTGPAVPFIQGDMVFKW